jgi:aspartokinase/homoserine dehydrogenase 1
MNILKFGGTSVGTVESVRRVVDIIKQRDQEDAKRVVVVSAFGGVTDQLIEIASRASSGKSDYRDMLSQLEKRHIDTINALLPASGRSDLLTDFKITLNELEDILQGVSLTRELTAKTLDLIVGFGERFSAGILASVLNSNEVESTYLDTRSIIKTDNHFGSARVLTAETYQNIRSYVAEHNHNVIVATGYIASTINDESTTIGRGGSDYTASLFGAALEADAIEIWTDVDGLMTADPKKVEHAFSVEHASYEEAMELSHFGARVIYPPTIQPALRSGIPIWIKNTFRPEHPGTLITKKTGERGTVIRGISSIDQVSLITIKGSGMIGVTGVASRIFGALADKRINIILITQSSSEHTITLAVLPSEADRAKSAIREEFEEEFDADSIDEIEVENDLSVIAVVGDNMRQIPGIAGRVFQALGRNGINISAIAQGSSERNISFVVDRKNEKKAMNTLHDAFFLSGVKTMNLFLVGTGLIGSTLLEMLKNQAQDLFDQYQLEMNIRGISNSRNMAIGEEPIPIAEWEQYLEEKGGSADMGEFVKTMKSMNLPNSIFIDCTASDEIPAFYEEVLSSTISIATPNKVANSSVQEQFNLLQKRAAEHNCAYLFETNVGAGLPVIGTLSEMVATGDQIHKIEGVLSGTLSYLFNSYDGSESFSKLVRKAREMGFTEPDPREDLNGHDVGRKLLILARVSGYELEFDDIAIQNLVPQPAQDCDTIESFFEKLEQHDEEFEELLQKASSSGNKLCYIARYEQSEASVKLEEIGPEHPFYNLSGSDNILSIHSTNYNEYPMVIKGPGAGANVTAAGIVADILRIANTKAYSNAGW